MIILLQWGVFQGRFGLAAFWIVTLYSFTHLNIGRPIHSQRWESHRQQDDVPHHQCHSVITEGTRHTSQKLCPGLHKRPRSQSHKAFMGCDGTMEGRPKGYSARGRSERPPVHVLTGTNAISNRWF